MSEWQNFEDKIKQVANQETLPESLNPENIEKMLKNQQEKEEKIVTRKIPRWAGYVAACFAILLCISTFIAWGRGQIKKEAECNCDAGMEKKEATPSEKEAVLLGAASEDEIYEHIKELQGGRVFDFSYGVDGSIAVPEKQEAESLSNGSAEMEDSAQDKESGYSQTNIQEKGVDEADLIKTNGKYIFICRENRDEIAIVSANGANMETVSNIVVSNETEEDRSIQEFFVKGDNLIVQSSLYRAAKQSNLPASTSTCISIYDVSDGSNPKLVSEKYQDGYYESSRISGDYLYTFSVYEVVREINKDKPETYIPSVDGEVLSCREVYLPEENVRACYKVITALDITKPDDFTSTKAVLAGGSEWCYVSANAIYFLAGSSQEGIDGYNATEIWKFSYDNGIIVGSARGTVKGSISDQFAMSESSDGYLRVVSTYWKQEAQELMESQNKEMALVDVAVISKVSQRNGLYILDENLNVVGSLEDLAPEEQIYSARFFDKTAYFVTFRQTDPLFSVDVSDPTKPVLLGELKIPGFSEYLHPYGENLLLGIGYEADENGRTTGIKLSMFDVSDPGNVREIAKEMVVQKKSDYSYFFSPAIYNHKAVLIDVEKNIIGMNVEGGQSGEMDENSYVIYGYDKERGFYQKHKSGYTANSNSYAHLESMEYLYGEIRGLYIGDYLYTVQLSSSCAVQCFDMKDNFKLVGEVVY